MAGPINPQRRGTATADRGKTLIDPDNHGHLPVRTVRYCPNCGSESLYACSEKAYQCKQCEFLYYHNVAATSSAIIEVGDEVLLVVRGHEPERGKLDLPGGFVEYHETAEQALIRELKEEIAIEVSDPLTYLCNFPNTYDYAGINYHTLDFYYVLTMTAKPVIRVDDDVAGFAWFKRHEVPLADTAFASTQNAFRCYQQSKDD